MSQPFLPFVKSVIDESTITAVCNVLRSGWLTSGPKVKEFEATLSRYFNGRPVRTFNSGTSSLEVGLRIAGVGPGDEVITTPLSWVATANVILAVGATPVFVDIDWTTRNIDVTKIEGSITPRTKAVMPVHLAGRPVDMSTLLSIAEKHGLRVVEDAAQAIGSSFKGQRVGAFGDITAFSFQATKNITTGEGGCLVLNNADEAVLAEKLRLHGVGFTEDGDMEVDVLGSKRNMNEISAVIGLEQFSQIDATTKRRRALAQQYLDGFGPDFEKLYGVQLPNSDMEDSNWHLFQIVLPESIPRREFRDKLQNLHRIGTGVHYPPIHLFKLYREREFHEGMFPVAEKVGGSIVTLPMFYSMTEGDVERVVAAVLTVLSDSLPN